MINHKREKNKIEYRLNFEMFQPISNERRKELFKTFSKEFYEKECSKIQNAIIEDWNIFLIKAKLRLWK